MIFPLKKKQENPRTSPPKKIHILSSPELLDQDLLKENSALTEGGLSVMVQGLPVLGVLSQHLKCEMKSPHLLDFS